MTQLASDNFTRGNSSGLGSNWTTVTAEGIFNIVSNKAVVNTQALDSCMFFNGITWPNDHYSEITVSVPGSPGVTNTGLGCLVRASSSAQTYYRCFVTGPSGNLQIRKRIAGTGTALVSTAGSVIAGDKVRFQVQGTTLSVYINGVLSLSTTDASISTGNAGIHYSSTDSNVDSISLWTGGDFTAPTPPPITIIPPTKRRTYIFYDYYYPR